MAFPTQDKPVIIATKGLPYTWTGYVAKQISGWAQSPWVSLDYVLEELYEERGYNPDRRPTEEEDERLHRLAFSRLCKAASFQVRQRYLFTKFNCVVLESPLSSTKDLDRLIELSTDDEEEGPLKLIIIEARLRHKHIWNIYVVDHISKDNKWYLPRSWVEVEEAIRDYDAKAWDEHYHLMCSRHPHLKRFVLDPFRDIRRHEIVSPTDKKVIWSPFAKAIEYLLTDEAAPSVVEYCRWRKKLVEGILITRGANMCSDSATGDCIFKYTTNSTAAAVGGGTVVNCRACEQPVPTGQEGAYMCVSCNLALHKSCAEFPPVDFYSDVKTKSKYGTFDPVLDRNREMTLHACKSPCMEFSYECGGCLFETHLKCLLPTVVDIPHLHPHSLSIQFFPDKGEIYSCELCSLHGVNCSYYCVICNTYYDLRCAHSPAQVEHQHGGYRHLMNLILPTTSTATTSEEDPLAFSSDDYLDPDDSWCQVCYRDLNAQAGFYACQDCPDYVAHVICISPTWKGTSING